MGFSETYAGFIMANRAFLIQSSRPAPFQYDLDSPDVLAAASNCVPVYWYSLFDRGCIATNTVALHDGQTMDYACFVTPTIEGRARSARRKDILRCITPASHNSVLEGWFQFLDGVELPYIHLETAEFCMLAEGTDDLLRASVDAFDFPPSSLSSHPAWLEMLDIAQIDPNDLTATVAGHKLAGYQWERPVTWNFKT